MIWHAAVAFAAPLYTAPEVVPYLRDDTSALIANHYLLQSMFAIDAAPSTLGVSVKSSPAEFAVADGNTAQGALTKWTTVALLGGGKPTSGAAWFVGVDYAHLVSTAFPNLLRDARGDDPTTVVSVGGGSAVFFAGGAYQGVAFEAGVFVNGADYTSNGLGEFGEGCSLPVGCYDARPGAPFPDVPPPEIYSVTRQSYLFNLEQKGGHSLSALVARREVVPGELAQGGLAMLRGLTQPFGLFPKAVGLLGAGVNTFGPEVDLYGDRARSGADASESRRMWEVPLVGDQLANSGLLGRLTFQVAPVPAFRLVEVGWADDIEVGDRSLFQAGARGKLFRRDTAYVPSLDAFAGLFQVDADREGRGWSTYATFSYNSPDPLVFPPVADAAVIGLQFVAGNPIAMPPPVQTLKYPEWMSEAE